MKIQRIKREVLPWADGCGNHLSASLLGRSYDGHDGFWVNRLGNRFPAELSHCASERRLRRSDAGYNRGPMSAIAAKLRLLKRRVAILGRRLSSRQKWAAGAVLVLLLSIVGWLFLAAGNIESTAEPVPLTPAEQFTLWYGEFQSTEDPNAKIDDFVIDDAMLQQLSTLDRLTTIQVESDSVTPETVAKLAAMPKLEQLHLRGAAIDDSMLASLATSPTIWLLNLPMCNVSPEAIEGLDKMSMLRQLRLGIKTGDNRHARAVATLSRLRAVHLIGVGVTDEGLQPLAKMPQLESLYLDDTAVTELGWTWLFENNPQLHVHINQLHHDRDPQKH